MLNTVPLSLRINGHGFEKWAWLAKFLQTEPPLEKSWLRPWIYSILCYHVYYDYIVYILLVVFLVSFLLPPPSPRHLPLTPQIGVHPPLESKLA